MGTSPKKTPSDRAVSDIARGKVDEDLSRILEAAYSRIAKLVHQVTWIWRSPDDPALEVREIDITNRESQRIELLAGDVDDKTGIRSRRPIVVVDPTLNSQHRGAVLEVILETRAGMTAEDAQAAAWETPAIATLEQFRREVVTAPFDGDPSTTA